ncbi:unnamed protein product [Effrenium voratum]|uniref:Uncharacterized protein n=1 Tax=Effrenium voratum TaxID=2562239 RepID=A0AA36JRT4_9DINO|nr:unnamed protein product [Effrenium voratum]
MVSQGEPGEPRFIQGTFVLVQTALSLLVGLGIALCPSVSPQGLRLHEDWRARVRRCVDPKATFYQLPARGLDDGFASDLRVSGA